MAKERNGLSLSEKVNVIQEYKSCSISVRELAKKFKVGKTQIAKILSNKEDILNNYENNLNNNRRRKIRTTENSELNTIIWEWFCTIRSKNVPISGPLLQEKALQFAKELNISDFKASSGWLHCFKKTHNISNFKICGESAAVDQIQVEEWKTRIKDLCQGFRPEDIFNCDETGLFYRALPHSTFAIKCEQCKGGKVAKERMSVLITVSMTGERLKPVVIGKSASPRCFKNIDINKLPVTYYANSRAWMTSSIFSEYLKNLNRMMHKSNRQILLFMDNAPCHPRDLPILSNVTVKFLPANTTSVLQPCDLGIIRTMKAHYRKLMLQYVVTRINTMNKASDLIKCISILDAIMWTVKSLESIKESTISKCFANAGFSVPIYSGIENEEEITDDLMNLFQNVNAELSVDQFLDIDDTIATDNVFTNEFEKDLISDVKERIKIQSKESDDEANEFIIKPIVPLTPDEIIDFSERFISQFGDHSCLGIELRTIGEDMKYRVQKSKRYIQPSIENYFRPI